MTALPLQQSPTFAAALKAYGADVASTAPVILQRHFGPLGRIDFASRVQVSELQRRPRIINGERDDPAAYRRLGYRQIMTPVHIAEWDLTGTLRRGMQAKWRNALRRGLSHKPRVRLQSWAGDTHWLFDHADRTARDRSFRALPTQLLACFARDNPGAALLFEISRDDVPMAACLILRHGPTATYQTAWASAEGRATNAARVLLDDAAHHMAALGHTTLDLGTVETDHAPGLARFKLGTGARLRRLGGTWLRMP